MHATLAQCHSLPLALVVSVLLGVADCFCNMIEIIILGDYSRLDPSKGLQARRIFHGLAIHVVQVYSIFKALAKFSTGISGLYASYMPLEQQLLISVRDAVHFAGN